MSGRRRKKLNLKKMKTNLQKQNKNQIKATVELGREDLQKYLDKAESVLGGNLEIKGFRKGKMPKDLLKKYLDHGQVRALALDMAVEESLSDVIREKSFDVLNTSQLSVDKNDSTHLKYSVLLDLFPYVELSNLSQTRVDRRDVKVEEKEVDDAIEVIENSRASFVSKNDDEAVEEGDRVEVDFDVKRDDQIIEEGGRKNQPFIIGGRNFIPGFEDQLVGMKKGDGKTFSLIVPDDYFHKEVAGKKLDFDVRINDVKKVIRPGLNDDFARSLGQFASLAEFRESVRDGLVQEKKVKENQRLRLEILDDIIDRSRIDVPESLLAKQLDIMVADFDNTLHEKGLELGLYLAGIDKTQEELKKDWARDAEKQVKISLILRKLAKKLKIEASQEEIEEMAGQVIQTAMTRSETGSSDIDPAKIKENIESRIVNEKTLKYIESHCAI